MNDNRLPPSTALAVELKSAEGRITSIDEYMYKPSQNFFSLDIGWTLDSFETLSWNSYCFHIFYDKN